MESKIGMDAKVRKEEEWIERSGGGDDTPGGNKERETCKGVEV